MGSFAWQEPVSYLLMGVGGLTAIISGFHLFWMAFQKSIWWGLGYFFLAPVVQPLFILLYIRETWKSVLWHLAGWAILACGLLAGGWLEDEGEAGAVKTLERLAEAQTKFHEGDAYGIGANSYARAVSHLVGIEGRPPLELVPARLLAAFGTDLQGTDGKPYGGYLYLDLTPGLDPRPVQSAALVARYYTYLAYPAEYRTDTARTFFITEQGVIYGKDTGGHPIAVIPVDPQSEGWERVGP